MASHQKPTLSLLERLDLAIAIPQILCTALIRSLFVHSSRARAGWSYKRTLAISMIQSVWRLTLRQRQIAVPPTGDSIRSYCSKNDVPLKSTTIDCGSFPQATLHKLSISGSSSTTATKKIYFYFHGGGYISALSDGHFPITIASAKQAGIETLCFLEYSLAPDAKYPTQLVQSAFALQHLLQIEGYTPSQVVLGGDSAGGHLVLSLLAHLKQPHPQAPTIDLIGQKLRGAVLQSPWVSMTYDSGSFEKYESRDMLAAKSMTFMTELWEPSMKQVWGDLLPMGTPELWSDLPVSKVLITAGGWECFLDDILAFSKLMGATESEKSSVRLVVGDSEIHVQSAVDGFVGLPWTGTSTEVLRFMKSLA